MIKFLFTIIKSYATNTVVEENKRLVNELNIAYEERDKMLHTSKQNQEDLRKLSYIESVSVLWRDTYELYRRSKGQASSYNELQELRDYCIYLHNNYLDPIPKPIIKDEAETN